MFDTIWNRGVTVRWAKIGAHYRELGFFKFHFRQKVNCSSPGKQDRDVSWIFETHNALVRYTKKAPFCNRYMKHMFDALWDLWDERKFDAHCMMMCFFFNNLVCQDKGCKNKPLCRELVCITVKWTWYNGRDNFFHITSGRINTWKGVNQFKELFFLNLIFFF